MLDGGINTRISCSIILPDTNSPTLLPNESSFCTCFAFREYDNYVTCELMILEFEKDDIYNFLAYSKVYRNTL
jgi:hypothetical protein